MKSCANCGASLDANRGGGTLCASCQGKPDASPAAAPADNTLTLQGTPATGSGGATPAGTAAGAGGRPKSGRLPFDTGMLYLTGIFLISEKQFAGLLFWFYFMVLICYTWDLCVRGLRWLGGRK